MTIHFENYGNFSVTLHYSDVANVYYECATGYTLKECTDFIENRMNENSDCISADIVDIYTGEIVAIIENEEEEIEQENWYDYRDDYFDEVGFDPYMGCYSDDC